MDHHLLNLLAILGAVLVAAKAAGGLAERLGIPAVIAELGTGIILGNLAWMTGMPMPLVQEFESSQFLTVLSELGVFFLLFVVGLETEVEKIAKVGKDAFLAAVLGVVVPVGLAFLTMPLLGSSFTTNQSLFLAAALAATSVGITARVLRDANSLKTTSGQVILGAAVIDDVLGIIVLTVVSAIVTQGTVGAGDIGIIILKVFAFGALVVFLRSFVIPRSLKVFSTFEVQGMVTVLMLGFCLLWAWAAQMFGLAGIIGAFALGIVLDALMFKGFKEAKELHLEQIVKPVTDFLVPIFFVHVGMSVKLTAVMNSEAISLALLLIVCGVIGKQVCGLALSKKSIEMGADRMLVGLGMIPRGEVGLIFASIGKSLNVLGDVEFGAVVAMVTVTTFVPPFLISWRAKKLQA